MHRAGQAGGCWQIQHPKIPFSATRVEITAPDKDLTLKFHPSDPGARAFARAQVAGLPSGNDVGFWQGRCLKREANRLPKTQALSSRVGGSHFPITSILRGSPITSAACRWDDASQKAVVRNHRSLLQTYLHKVHHSSAILLSVWVLLGCPCLPRLAPGAF